MDILLNMQSYDLNMHCKFYVPYSVSAFVHISNFLPHESRQIHLHVYEKMKYVLAHKNIGGSIFLKIMLGLKFK